jgi:hypothetical protein
MTSLGRLVRSATEASRKAGRTLNGRVVIAEEHETR